MVFCCKSSHEQARVVWAGEEQPHAVICPSNLFGGGGEDALLQPEGLRRQRLPQLVSRQAGLELQRQEAMSSDGGSWP